MQGGVCRKGEGRWGEGFAAWEGEEAGADHVQRADLPPLTEPGTGQQPAAGRGKGVGKSTWRTVQQLN